MRKFTLLALLLVTTLVVKGQTNLVVNGGFENWVRADSVANWTSVKATNQTFSKETTIVHSGTSSILSNHTGTSGTAKIFTKPYANPVVPGTTYTFSFWYYADATGTTNLAAGLRMWGYWENPDGSNGTFDQSNLQPTGYIDLTGNTGAWKQFSVDIIPPVGSGQVELDIRFYKGTKIYIDDVSLVAKTSGLNDVKEQKLNVWVSNGKISFQAKAGEKVELFNTLGKLVLVQNTSEGINTIVSKNKGIVIVKVGNRLGKVVY